jgi:hypothetical protein
MTILETHKKGEREFEKEMVGIKGGIGMSKTQWDKIQSHILSREIAMLESVVEWVKKYHSTRKVKNSDIYKIGQNHGRQEVVYDLFSHLQSQIDELKKLLVK